MDSLPVIQGMATYRRPRKPNFTQDEKRLLFRILNPYVKLLETNAQGKDRLISLKHSVWIEVTQLYNQLVASLPGYHVTRNINELRNFLHNYRKGRGITGWLFLPEESKGAGVAGNSSYAGYSDNVSGGENTHCDDVSVDLSPDQILGDDGDVSRASVSPPAQRPESFKLSHNNHLSIVLESLASDESFMDVTLTAQGKSIKAHKSVLSAVSPYFKSVLRENPCQHPIIIMPRDITFDQLKNIIAYVYKGEMTVAASELSNLLKTAELLQVSGLSPSETSGNSFNEDANSPQESTPSKWMDYSSPVQRMVKTPVKPAKSKKRPRTPSREGSPATKRTAVVQDTSSEMTCVKEEIASGNEFEELDYQPANSGVDDPGENSTPFSLASEASLDSDEPHDPVDPLLVPKTETPPDTLFECAYCSKSFAAKEEQETHMKTTHPNKQICVCNCGKSFESSVELEDHKQSCLMI